MHRGRRPGGVADRTARDADPLDQELDELPALLGGRPLYVIGLPLLYTFLLTTVLAGLSNVLSIWALPGEMGGFVFAAGFVIVVVADIATYWRVRIRGRRS